MATDKKKSSAKKHPGKGLTDNQRWVYGAILFFFAAAMLVAVVSYLFTWADDQSFVRWGDMWCGDAPQVKNSVGKLGAVVANLVVGRWFGLFGIIIPAVLLILSLRVLNFRPMRLRRSVRVALVGMILGSLTLGFIFGTRWGVFGTGLGGAQGIFVSQWIRSYIGVAGTSLLLVTGWILLAVYINRNTISVVNRFGKGIYDGGRKVGETVVSHTTGLVGKHGEDDNEPAGTDGPEPTQQESRPTVKKRRDAVLQEPVVQGMPEPVFEPVNLPGETDRSPSSDFEVTDGRITEKEEGEFTIVSPSDSDAELNIVVLGDSEGPFEVTAPQQEQYAGAVGEFGVGEFSTGAGSVSHSVASSIRTSAGGIEVVELTGTPLSVGGVVESSSPGGVRPDDKLEVIVAERKDVVLDDDEIDDALYDPTKELSKYQKPPVELLEDHTVDVRVTEEEIYENKNQIVRTLENFGIKIDKIKATIGPTVTLYEIVPAAGVKISKIKNLEDDIALSLKALGIRIIAPMPGKGTVGIEVPNKDKEVVSMYSVIKTMKFQESKYELPVVLGKTISNETFIIDLAKMPHLLVAGSTGQGKSVGLNAIITSLLYRKHPAELKFVLVDPKRVELSLYGKLEKHFLAKMASEEEAILTDTQKVVYTLNALCQEMSERYDLLRMAEVKKISEYNDKFLNRRLNPNKGHRFLPYIVVVIDEFADMIMTAGREVEAPITRLAQLARAVGIHLVIATQRPDVKVITGLIKANFPARIAFRVMSMVDSRTIIDQPGANQLIGRGDMLMSLNGELTRVQCAFIDTPEIERITEFIGNQKGYAEPYELPDYVPDSEAAASRTVDMDHLDPMFDEVARFVVQNQQGSISSIQRRFSIGYNRAGRIMDQLEAAGVVGRAEGSKPREVLIMDIQSLEYMLGKMQV